jgi:hypothetical protein
VGRKRACTEDVSEKPEGKRLLGITGTRCEDNIDILNK